MTSGDSRPDDARSGPVRLEDLALSEEQLAQIAVSDARRAVRGLEELGREPALELRELAAGDQTRVAAYVARHSHRTASDVA